MLGPQLMELLLRIRGCEPIGGNASLGTDSEVSKAYTIPSLPSLHTPPLFFVLCGSTISSNAMATSCYAPHYHSMEPKPLEL